MLFRKFRVVIVMIFLGIFSAKMVISIAPAFSCHLDKLMVNSVIMQLELEQSTDKESSKSSVKLLEPFKLFCNNAFSFKLHNSSFYMGNNFIEHFKRYVNPYHPSVPTPPPNLS